MPAGAWAGAPAGRAVVAAIRVERRIEESMVDVGCVGLGFWLMIVVMGIIVL